MFFKKKRRLTLVNGARTDAGFQFNYIAYPEHFFKFFWAQPIAGTKVKITSLHLWRWQFTYLY